ncbi:hypothetical protein CLAFUW4_20056 [Fulvia fulva]|uniref:uncharacterized protein n=1 Tax=Passalora fulva TaxID=5499 RepID=UPI002852C091|nr:uncharacterized protein CLAFUR5_20056 [Fulvia fulva]KAK4621690.1 hypothetical protein CLAFUR4_20056 [Fulvia fulva]WMI38931.1 hypothetical protein CLAFUR5_20056 [Fulvia fulva]WPV16322.1 hypothetical protein CLAFUW4_20056 [Fulvia fulva]WPV31099.1 hypothetical protein CLAFUW7_20056 [Fulvia fulva]
MFVLKYLSMVVAVLGFTTAVWADGTCDAADPQICYEDGKTLACSSVRITSLEHTGHESAHNQAGILPDCRKSEKCRTSRSPATNHRPICSAEAASRR